MRDLRQEEFHVKSAIENVLASFVADFRSRVSNDQLDRMATRLTIWGFTARKIDEAMEIIAGRADEKFPTPLQVKEAINGKQKSEKEAAPRDPQIEKDKAKFKRHYAQFQKALGHELLNKYIEVWHAEFFKGSEDLGIFESVLPSKPFNQLAIADLARANGNARRAIEMVRAEKVRNSKNQGDTYEDDSYIVPRTKNSKDAYFVMKDGNR